VTAPRIHESTEVGEQSLIDGVRPVTLGERLTFDEVGRAQIDLLDLISTHQ